MNKINIREIIKNKRLKSIIYKSIFTMVVLLIVFLLTKINTNPTNSLLDTVKTSINYEFHIRDDSVRMYNKAKNVFNSTIESIPVFNTNEKLPSPVHGRVIRSFDYEVETPDGKSKNGGVEIKIENEMSPKSILNGRVTHVQKRDSKGYFVTLEEGNIEIIYGYLEKTHLKEGDLVRKNDIIGDVGINKDGSKYLRLEFYIDREAVDPEKYIDFKEISID